MKPCPKTNCKNNAVIDSVFGVLPCDSCQDSGTPLEKMSEFDSVGKQNRVQEMRDKNSKDMIQPWEPSGTEWKPNPEFVRAYPEYRKTYFTPEQLKDVN